MSTQISSALGIGALDNCLLIDYTKVMEDTTGVRQKQMLKMLGLNAVLSGATSFNLKSFLVGIIGSVAEDVMGRYGLNTIPFVTEYAAYVTRSLPTWYYSFHINPIDFMENRKKLQTITNYGWGQYDLEQWGNDLVTLDVKGTTGLLLPSREGRTIIENFISKAVNKVSGINVGGAIRTVGYNINTFAEHFGVFEDPRTDIRLSIGYLQLEILKRFYNDSSQRLIFSFMGRGYFGFFENFRYGMNADNPRRIDYNFGFKAHPELIFDAYSMDFSKFPSDPRGVFAMDSNMMSPVLTNTTLYGLKDWVGPLKP
jgi:hypothetical protein